MKLSLTYSAFREMEQIPEGPLREIGAAILALAANPLPDGSSAVQGQGGCRRLSLDGYYILYHVGHRDEGVTVLGVVEGAVQTIH